MRFEGLMGEIQAGLNCRLFTPVRVRQEARDEQADRLQKERIEIARQSRGSGFDLHAIARVLTEPRTSRP